MKFTIVYGVPKMERLMNEFKAQKDNGTISDKNLKIYNRILARLELLSNDPRNSILNTHKIDQLSAIKGYEVWQSYLENNKPRAARIFWIYGPNKKHITILGIEPHPDKDKYQKLKLDDPPSPDDS